MMHPAGYLLVCHQSNPKDKEQNREARELGKLYALASTLIANMLLSLKPWVTSWNPLSFPAGPQHLWTQEQLVHTGLWVLPTLSLSLYAAQAQEHVSHPPRVINMRLPPSTVGSKLNNKLGRGASRELGCKDQEMEKINFKKDEAGVRYGRRECGGSTIIGKGMRGSDRLGMPLHQTTADKVVNHCFSSFDPNTNNS